MSNLALDGFDHYGSGSAGRLNMLDGVYAEVSSVITPSTTNPRTGTHSLHCTGSVNQSFARRMFSERDKAFDEKAWFVTNLPTNSEKMALGCFVTAANAEVVTFALNPSGQIEIRNGGITGAVLATSASNAFLPSSWQHIGCMAEVNGASGAAEVRVNGVVVASVSGVNLGTTDIGGVRWGQLANGIHGTGDWFIDDVRLGDALNGVQDDFVGDRRVILRQATRDGPFQTFTPDTGTTAWDRVDEVPPDDDASYIDGETVGDRAQIGFEALPAGVVQVDSIAYVAYGRKTDVGDATVRLNCVAGVASPQAEELGAEYPLNITYNYLPIQIFDEDPDAMGPWTVSGADAAMCEIERTA